MQQPTWTVQVSSDIGEKCGKQSEHGLLVIGNNVFAWFRANDDVVTAVAAEKVLADEAYLLFYGRICGPSQQRVQPSTCMVLACPEIGEKRGKQGI